MNKDNIQDFLGKLDEHELMVFLKDTQSRHCISVFDDLSDEATAKVLKVLRRRQNKGEKK